jgi:uncharacterized protein (TIGR03643 family)
VTKKLVDVDAVTAGEVIDMALSDHVSFAAINDLFGLNENQVKTLMRAHLRPARYRAWRTRVQTFSDRRTTYKRDSERDARRSVGPIVKHPVTLNDEDFDDAEPIPAPAERKSQPGKRSLSQP